MNSEELVMSNEEIAVNSEQITVNSVLVREHSVLPKRKAHKQQHCSAATRCFSKMLLLLGLRHDTSIRKSPSLVRAPFSGVVTANCSLLSALCSLLIVLCSLLFVTCNLFTGPSANVFEQISDEVDWSNAPKLTVRLEYPPAWGISNPQQGTITPAKDIRKGYEFSLEFTPDAAYTLSSWLVYKTSDLNDIPGNWVQDMSLIDFHGVQALGAELVTPPPSMWMPSAPALAANFTLPVFNGPLK
jgi:hypothetical protein